MCAETLRSRMLFEDTHRSLVFAKGKMAVEIISRIKPPRMDHLGFTIVTNLDAKTDTIAEMMPVGRNRTAVKIVLHPYSCWKTGIS